MKKVNIFGLGPSGAVIARRYAEMGYEVKGYEVRDHIAGNLFDYKDTNGVIVHKYGPHIFQTSDEQVINYVKQYAEFSEFRHKVNVNINGKEFPLPINFESIDLLMENAEEIKTLLQEEFEGESVTFVRNLLDSNNEVIKNFGQFIYENVFENYTTKMWDISPEEIDPSVLRRVPIRLSYDDGYFTDTFQAVPKEGYTKLIETILDHENISIELSIPSDSIRIRDGKLYIFGEENTEDINVYTGPIDALFDYKNGEVPYRSLKFEFEQKPEIYNSRYVVNYPAHESMTRITDYRLLSQQEEDESVTGTTIGREYPGDYSRGSEEYPEPYYPINNEVNNGIVNSYLEEAKSINNLLLLGRLTEYKYKQMGHTIKDALNLELIK